MASTTTRNLTAIAAACLVAGAAAAQNTTETVYFGPEGAGPNATMPRVIEVDESFSVTRDHPGFDRSAPIFVDERPVIWVSDGAERPNRFRTFHPSPEGPRSYIDASDGAGPNVWFPDDRRRQVNVWHADGRPTTLLLAQADGDPTTTQHFVVAADETWQGEPEVATYLGVATSPVPDAVRAQTDLPPGFGLVIEHIEPDSPAAAAGLQRHDILHKIGDQSLVNAQQLRTLVRAHASGDEVTLTVIRRGRPMEVTATLGEHTEPRVPQFLYRFNQPMARDIERRVGVAVDAARDAQRRFQESDTARRLGEARDRLREMTGRLREEISDRAREIDREKIEQWARELEDQVEQLDSRLEGMGDRARELAAPAREWLEQRGYWPGGDAAEDHVTANAVLSDDEHVLRLSITPEGRHLVAEDTAGKKLFDGPIDTPEQREAIPAAVREKLERLEVQIKPRVEVQTPEN